MIPELDLKLQSAEARCKVLEKQLEYMRKMVENAKKERNTFIENQVVQKVTWKLLTKPFLKLDPNYRPHVVQGNCSMETEH